MDENKEVKTEEAPRAIPAPLAPSAKTEEPFVEVKIPVNEKLFDFIYLACSATALSLLIITKIIANFVGGPVFVAVMAIFIYLTAFAGAAFGLFMTVVKKNKFSPLLIVNLATLALVLMIL